MNMIYIENRCLTQDSIDFLNGLPMFKHQKLKLAEDFIYLSEQSYAYKIKEIYLFGSCAKGTATVRSDIDLGVLLKEDMSLRERADLRQTWNDSYKHGVETNVVFIPPDFNNRLRLYQEIRKGIKLYGE